jgi:hypothetical protein
MIKRYLDFIKESQINGFNSLGEWVESLIEDQYVKNIINRYTQDIDPEIELSNAINILDKRIQNEIKNQIENYLQNGIQEKEPEVLASTDLEMLGESAGKGIFTSFLKALTALRQKETNPNFEKCPDNFLLFYYYPNLDATIVKQIFTRFKSLSMYLDTIDYGKNEFNLYFGLKSDGSFEYGIGYDNLTPIGQFKINQSIIKWMLSLESKSAQSLKKELVNLTLVDILTLGKIKSDMASFNPGYHEKKGQVIIRDRIISFAWYGVGKWDNGKLDEGELMNIKTNFTNFVLGKKWGEKILISIKPSSFWLNIHIKLK